MADMTPANVAADAAANTVNSGSVRGAVAPDAATTAFLNAVPNTLAESVFNLLQTAAAAALKVDGDTPDPDLLRTYGAPSVNFSSNDSELNYSVTLRFKSPASIGTGITALTD